MKQSISVLFTVVYFGLCAEYVQARQTEIPRTDQSFDLAVGIGSGGIYSGALSWNRTHGLFESGKLRLGYGLRLSLFGGSDLNYITAPANLTSEDRTIDTLVVSGPSTMGLSANIHIQYMFGPRLKAGFNIDALGAGFGSSGNATFISSDNAGEYPAQVSAKPTPYNVLLGGDNDIGQIKSEFFLAYAITSTTWLRGGMDMTFSEYTTEQKLTHDNDRFRYKAVLFFLGISFNPFR